MTSKVTAKLPLGVAFSMLLVSLALFVGCKQEADNSYTPPGYGATVGYLTDTTWKSGNETIKFGAEGSVTVPNSMKKIDTEFGVVEFGDFTYSVSGTTVTISAKVKQVPESVQGSPSKEPGMSKDEGGLSGESEGAESEQVSLPKVGDIIPVVECTIGVTVGVTAGDTSTKDYYQMKVTPNFSVTNSSMPFTMENKPTSGDKFVGTYYDEWGVKEIQINKDGTFVSFNEGGKYIRNWTFNENGTISVTPIGSDYTTTYYLYPHALCIEEYDYIYYK